METKIPSIYKVAVDIWFQFYRAKTGQEYVFSGIDGKHIKQILTKVKTKVVQKGLEPTDENILNSFRGLLMSINDKWMLENLEIKNVNCNFNSTYAKAVRNNPFTKSQQYTDFAERKFGAGSKSPT
jgi:hypothetical protein